MFTIFVSLKPNTDRETFYSLFGSKEPMFRELYREVQDHDIVRFHSRQFKTPSDPKYLEHITRYGPLISNCFESLAFINRKDMREAYAYIFINKYSSKRLRNFEFLSDLTPQLIKWIVKNNILEDKFKSYMISKLVKPLYISIDNSFVDMHTRMYGEIELDGRNIITSSFLRNCKIENSILIESYIDNKNIKNEIIEDSKLCQKN